MFVKRKVKNKADEKFWKAIVFFLVFIVVFLITLGTFDVNDNSRESLLEKNKKEDKKLQKLNDKKQLKQKEILEIKKTVNRILLYIRIGLVIFWLGINSALYFLNIVADFNNLILYNNAFIIAIIVVLYVIRGSISNIRDVSQYFNKVLESIIFRKKLHKLHTDVVEIEKKMLKTEVKIQSLNSKLQ